MLFSFAAMGQGGSTQNASGWKVVGNEVQLQDTNLRVNMGNHLATEKADIKGNLRVREMADLPDTTPANNQLLFRTMFIDNSGRFYRGPERHLPELPIERPEPPVVVIPGGSGGGLWQPSGSDKLFTDRWVGIGTSSPKVSLDVNGHFFLHNGNNAAVMAFPATGAIPNLFIRSDDDPFTYEAASERMFIGSNGRVGIMNTNPQATLDVAGNVRFRSDLSVADKITTRRLTSPDSLLFLGDSSIVIWDAMNNIRGNTTGTYKGLGLGAYAYASGIDAVAMGYAVRATAMNSMVIGFGPIFSSGDLINNIPNSVMIGANSIYPSIFVAPALSGADPIGRVGIGTTVPGEQLDVSGRIRSSSGFIYNAGNGNQWWMAGTANGPAIMMQQHAALGGATNRRGSLGWIDNNLTRYEFLTWNDAGYVGIGTTNPVAKLDIGDLTANTLKSVLARLSEGSSSDEGTYLGIKSYDTQPVYGKSFAIEHKFYGALNNAINFCRGGDYLGGYITFATNNGAEKVRITSEGNVGIGTTNPGNFKLAVEGKLGARALKITLASWSDFVFQKDYKLMSLKEIEKFINHNKHLPDIPSSKEVEDNGIDVAEMLAKQMQKIEELTLHMIELNKKIEILEKENKWLKK